MRFTTLLLAIGVACGFCQAQELRLRNTSEDTIVMKFLPTSERPKKMTEVTIPPTDEFISVNLYGPDPYDVSFSVKRTTEGGAAPELFHAKVGRPIPLRALSGQGVFDVRIALAQSFSRGRPIYQASQASLIGRNDNVKVFASPSNASEFIKEVVNRRWDTAYEALNGNTYQAIVDFGKVRFETSSFVGRFTDLAIFEDRDGCHIAGGWSAMDSRGDVFFYVSRDRPEVMRGEYTFDGDRQRYVWESR